MTVSSTTDKSGPYNGNGVTVAFDYEFRILDATHISVVKKSAAGVETVLSLSEDYDVSGVGAAVGGTVTLDTPLPNGETLTIIRNAPFTQMTDLENQGAYFAETIERALDLGVMRDQQLAEGLDRAVKIPVSADASELDGLIEDIVRLGDSAANIDTVAGIAGAVAAVADVAADVSEVSAVAAAVPVVAGIAGAVTTVAADGADIGAVAAISANVQTVAGIAGAVVAVAANEANIDAVAGNAANINAVAGIEAEIIAVPDQVAAAVAAKEAAEAAAAGVNLPSIQPGDAGKALLVNEDEDGYELGSGGGGSGIQPTDTDASGFGFVNSAGPLGSGNEKLPSEGVVKAYVDANAGGNYQRVPGNSTFAILTSVNKMSQRADLRDWNGLDLTGSSDMASLVQSAANTMAGSGEKLYVPPGLIVMGSTITIPDGCHIEGASRPGGQFAAKYPFFYFAHPGVGFKIDTNLGARSLKNFGTYRNQPAPGGGAYTPTAFGYDLDIEGGQDIELENINFMNATKAVNIRGKQSSGATCGRITMKGIRGQPLQEGIRMTHCTDVCYLDDVHFWPIWSGNANVHAYTRANLSAFILGRVDNLQCGRLFSWGASRALSIILQAAAGSLPTGSINRLWVSSFDADNCTVAMLVPDAVDTGITADFGSFKCASDPAVPSISASPLLWLQGDGINMHIGSLRGQYTNESLVALAGANSKLVIGNSESAAIDNDANGSPEFSVAASSRIELLAPAKSSAGTVTGGAGMVLTQGYLQGSAAWNPGSLANGASAATLVGVTGAALGDIALASFTSITSGNWHISAIVNTTNQVTVSIENVTGGTVDLPNGTVNVRVLKP